MSTVFEPDRSTYKYTRGARHHSAKMTAAKVQQARKSYATGRWTIAGLARKYGVAGPTMAAILYGRTWRHLK